MKDDTELDLSAVKDQVESPRESAAAYEEGGGSAEMSWSPGAIVRRAREAKNLSIADLSLQIKLPVRTLKALETDDFDALSEPVFVRGYYRRCAQALGVPSGDVVKAYERASGEPPPGPLPLKPMMAEEMLHQPKRWLPYALFIIVAGLLVASLFWWGQPVTQNVLSGTSGNTTTPNQTAAPSDSVALPSAADSDTDTMSLPEGASNNTSEAPSSNNSALATTPSGNADQPNASSASSNQNNEPAAGESDGQAQLSTPSQASAADGSRGSGAMAGSSATTTAGTASANSTLDVTFNQESWVRVVDANGKRLLNGLVPAGVEHKLHGKPPFDVLLGYAPGVTLTLNGKPVSLSGSVQSNNTAHVEVGGS